MAVSISTTEAARHLGEYLARIKHRGERFVLTRNERPVAELIPVVGSHTATWGQVLEALAGLPADPGFADDLETVNRADLPAANPWD
ncbi:MAG: type II toxin-antitoxin system Phd/YefM family antitoxin [Verrucomicrobiales bacterium]|nr:type II toxin-antitoxin system Phd/YefM family antitoxin [Verrucomicrobiales bacterium]